MNAPTLSLDAMFNMTEVNIGLVSDADMCLFLEEGMRGGVSYISKRYSQAIYIYFTVIFLTTVWIKEEVFLTTTNKRSSFWFTGILIEKNVFMRS